METRKVPGVRVFDGVGVNAEQLRDSVGRPSRRLWEMPFQAEADGVSALRSLVRAQLEGWGIQEVSDAAQLCVGELVANVIRHIGPGTPTTLSVSLSGGRLRIEVRDPDPRALPTLSEVGLDAESGRGMALIDAVTERWGVDLTADRKVTWCELSTARTTAHGQVPDDDPVDRAQAYFEVESGQN